jgi:hypothetical protein
MNGDAYQGNGDEEWMHTTNDMEDEWPGWNRWSWVCYLHGIVSCQ